MHRIRLRTAAVQDCFYWNKKTGETQDKIFRDIIDELNPGDCLVINNTKVIPARLMGVKEDTGAHIEVLLLKREQDDVWEVLVKPGKKAKREQSLHLVMDV